MRLGALEAGGTKMVMGIADENMNILRNTTCSTRLPVETMQDIIAFFAKVPLTRWVLRLGPVNRTPPRDLWLHHQLPAGVAQFRCSKRCPKRSCAHSD